MSGTVVQPATPSPVTELLLRSWVRTTRASDRAGETGRGARTGIVSARCRLSRHRSSVRDAREFVRYTLGSWRVETLEPDVSIVVSELVTNALRHGLGLSIDEDPFATSDDTLRCPVSVTLCRVGRAVLCAVHDPSAEVPRPADPDLMSGSGRGLQLVEALSSRWGWTQLSRSGGKAVWAVFLSPAPAMTQEGGQALRPVRSEVLDRTTACAV
jgi:anti-sigma regulatory factor (Ser/Thr protein kinase)